MRRSAARIIGAIGVLGCAGLALACGGGGEDPATLDDSPAPDSFSEAPVDGAPVVESLRIEPFEPAVGATVRAVAIARDPDGQPVQLGYRWFVDGAPQRTDEARFALTDVRKGAEIRVEVVATDGTHDSEAAEATVRVIDRIPSVTGVALSPSGSVSPGQPVSARAMVVDPDGDDVDVEYVWFVNGEEVEASGAMLETEGLAQGDEIYAQIRASDGAHWTRPERTAVVKVGSHHPEIRSTPPGFREDGVFRYEVEAKDPDGDRRLRYALLEGPDGMAIDAVLGDLVWRPTDDQDGVHPVRIEVRDSTGLATTQAFEVTVRRGEEADAEPPADAE